MMNLDLKKVDKTTNSLSRVVNVLVPILLAFGLAMIPMIIKGENPFKVYALMFGGSIFDARGIMVVLHYSAPLLLSGLAIAISYKAGLFNMGVESSIIVSGFTTAVLGYQLQNLPSAVLIPLLLVIGILVGIITAVIPAILKAFWNINEMVVTLLLNYAIIEILKYLATNQFRDPASGFVSTHTIGQNAMFKGILNSPLTMFFFIAIAVFVLVVFVMKRTKFGYELEAIGKNKNFSEAMGMNLRKKIIIIMLTSGALAGLAGAGWLMSEKYAYTLSFSGTPGLGWDGMVISLLGGHNPFGVLFSSLFYGVLQVGATEIVFNTSMPSEIIGIIQALLILFLSIKIIKDKDSIMYFRLKQFSTKLHRMFLRKDKVNDDELS